MTTRHRPAPVSGATGALPMAVVCAGCGWTAPPGELALRCPAAAAGDDVDHVLTRRLDPARVAFPTGSEANPFVRYRTLSSAYHRARAEGRSDAEIVELIERLDAAVERVDGRGFRITPFGRDDELSALLGSRTHAGVWVKDETGNVSGSHKGRHLFGTMLGLLLAGEDRARPLAIASCGNAALAAAVVARAAEWTLLVFVPDDAHPGVVARLVELGAVVTACGRRPGEAGDPPYLRLREAIGDGAIPFTCQGPENGLAIEGGLTIGYEMAEALRAGAVRLDRLFVQVGGGALASSVMQGLDDARALGQIDDLPRLHAVQTRNAHPLKRAYDLVLVHLLDRSGGTLDGAVDRVRDAMREGTLDAEMAAVARQRSAYMWPWAPAPRSVAGGILDDETYDWLAVVRAMLTTGGSPVVVSEGTLLDAADLARTTTGIDVDPTGAAGLAGLLRLRQRGDVGSDETSAVLFTGIRRNGDGS